MQILPLTLKFAGLILLTLLVSACGGTISSTATPIPPSPTPLGTVNLEKVGLQIRLPQGWASCSTCTIDPEFNILLYQVSDYPNGLVSLPINLDPELDGPFIYLGIVGSDTEAGQTIREFPTSTTTMDIVQWHYQGSSCNGAYTSLESGYTAVISLYGHRDDPTCSAINTIIATSGYFEPLISTPEDKGDLDWFQRFIEPLFREVTNAL